MTITLTREEAQQVLDALNRSDYLGWQVNIPITKMLRARLAQPEPEPVAWHEPGAYGNVTVYKDWAKENGWLPLYTTPPQREWQGLTDEEISELIRNTHNTGSFVRAIEAKLKEKNASHL
jgi:hypothetical protein